MAAADLLAVPAGSITEKGLRQNVNVGILYLEAWLRGTGCVPLYNLMEDAATSEISRAQVWQWVHNGAALSDGRKITHEALRDRSATRSSAGVRKRIGEAGVERREVTSWRRSSSTRWSRRRAVPEFLTLPAYDALMKLGA